MPDSIVTAFQALLDALHLQQFQHFHFLRPHWLLAAVPLYLIYRSVVRADDVLAPWREHLSQAMLEHLTLPGSQSRLLSPRTLYVPLAILAVLILAGPTWKQLPSPFLTDKSILVVALDVSRSMNQNDIQPSRLLRAKQKLNQLLALRGDAGTALIAFAGSAHIAMPVTDDRNMIHHFMDVLDHSIIPLQGQEHAAVLAKFSKIMDRVEVPGTLLLLTDGANQHAFEHYQAYFRDHRHQLVVWGIGEQSAPAVNDSLTPLNTGELTQLARAGGGRLVTFTHDARDVERVHRYVENNLVVSDDSIQPWRDEGYPLLFVFAALLLPWFRRGWSLQW